MPVSYEEFKGNKMIVLRRSDDDRYPLKFGMKKAELILDHVKEIEKFVNGEEIKLDTQKTEEEIKKAEKDGEFI